MVCPSLWFISTPFKSVITQHYPQENHFAQKHQWDLYACRPSTYYSSNGRFGGFGGWHFPTVLHCSILSTTFAHMAQGWPDYHGSICICVLPHTCHGHPCCTSGGSVTLWHLHLRCIQPGWPSRGVHCSCSQWYNILHVNYLALLKWLLIPYNIQFSFVVLPHSDVGFNPVKIMHVCSIFDWKPWQLWGNNSSYIWTCGTKIIIVFLHLLKLMYEWRYWVEALHVTRTKVIVLHTEFTMHTFLFCFHKTVLLIFLFISKVLMFS